MVKIISVAQLEDITNLKRTTLWRKRRLDPDFPQVIHLSERRIGFDLAEVEAWIDARRGRLSPTPTPASATASAE